MRRKKARRLHREALPPLLRAEAKGRIAVVARKRAEKVADARRAYRKAELEARAVRNAAMNAAYDEFFKQREAILDDVERKRPQTTPATA